MSRHQHEGKGSGQRWYFDFIRLKKVNLFKLVISRVKMEPEEYQYMENILMMRISSINMNMARFQWQIVDQIPMDLNFL